jgi:hypothetical protein
MAVLKASASLRFIQLCTQPAVPNQWPIFSVSRPDIAETGSGPPKAGNWAL